MSDISASSATTGSQRRLSEGEWPTHPSKSKYSGNQNTSVNDIAVNRPNTNEPSHRSSMADVVVENILPADSGIPPLNCNPDSQMSHDPEPGDTYSGAGPRGIPLDGDGWRYHISHQRYNGPAIDHNAMNELDRTEAFILGEGEKKIEEKIDTRTPNTTIFTFNKEDHTLANLLRDKLLKNSHVTFAAYRIPHPLFAKFELRVQTDGEITPKEAVLASSKDIIQDLNALKTNFTREYELRKMVGGAQNGI
ncbi:DNA-directed RNA polymerase II core subunit [Elasticomyces elasticus]|uniref:DNA-directed RNA polymerase II core subunit n=1 Tax=Exophiala sideris TaxID=1016849 RepID=A0ABR0J4D2_9EURO|nr:DNA-directed RNA polymerase II core subunit [Elasticomyces elasticus]KAK5026931.1 DNA-directed RNA polymerase II core subunit [Exophiala sideris]KAK5033935.1 DNA-directed RNA polymerase II core subunit [Exophiala sideris]KAK5055790.1 DNA-directed RNA polymerase II core subunit [Exophiala sideris]KAK5180877.1 DNA-directed RNA polymerase II core subunit [Eurotiomycetes sp. CCFEE 6388]